MFDLVGSPLTCIFVQVFLYSSPAVYTTEGHKYGGCADKSHDWNRWIHKFMIKKLKKLHVFSCRGYPAWIGYRMYDPSVGYVWSDGSSVSSQRMLQDNSW